MTKLLSGVYLILSLSVSSISEVWYFSTWTTTSKSTRAANPQVEGGVVCRSTEQVRYRKYEPVHLKTFLTFKFGEGKNLRSKKEHLFAARVFWFQQETSGGIRRR